jgi:hypothetical protein
MDTLPIMRRSASILFALIVLITSSTAGKPKIRVAADGFPTGQETPEGVATDYARVFMDNDTALLQRIAIPPYGGGAVRTQYQNFLAGLTEHLKSVKASGKTDPQNPSKILRVFAARHLTRNGPASWGYACCDFQDVMFVDLESVLNDGSKITTRTLVIKDHDGKWYVHPDHDVSPLLTYGLDDESDSKQTFAEVYQISK